jgi:uncharacterized repeat protein (TIGR03803 family)
LLRRIVNALVKRKWKRRAYAVFALCATTAITLPAQTFTTLHKFNGEDGSYPQMGMVQGTNGDLYGTTSDGGTSIYCTAGCGTVFKITPGGTLTTLHSFCVDGLPCTDGAQPWGGAMVQAPSGDFYAETSFGGAINEGTIFKMTPSGTLTTLYSFCALSDCADGSMPETGVIRATNGDFYGATLQGGANRFGTIFKVTPSGTLTTLHSFCVNGLPCTDGLHVDGPLVQATNGDLYGTTYNGGANNACLNSGVAEGCGTIFKMTPSGTLTTLYSFCSEGVYPDCTDGYNPVTALTQGADGDLYGMSWSGGAYNHGTIFKITPGGTLTTLYSFCAKTGCPDGEDPTGALVQATDFNFYGTTEYGGANQCPPVTAGCGTIFKMTPSGALTTIHSFDGTDGSNPDRTLVQATNGILYGVMANGGAGYGTVFSLDLGLGPFVKVQPASGEVGAAVEILGSDLTGATEVAFNGTAAIFKTVSKYLITTTVPAGASTGEVQVVTPGGILASNVVFRVLP